MAITDLRRSISDGFRNLVAGDDDVEGVFGAHPGDPGLMGPDSPAWRVHSDVSMFVGGVRALFLQTLHPLAMAGVAEHSDYRHDPLGRLQRTAAFVGTTTFAATPVAEQAIAIVRKVHDTVHGTAPDGRPYSANDPDLLTWVHTAEVDSFLRAYQRYGSGHLTPEEVDRYYDDVAAPALALGAAWVPRSAAEVREYFAGVRPELKAGRQARSTARWLMMPPLPLPTRPAYAVLCGAAVGLLPGWVRRDLRIPVAPVTDALVVRPTTKTMLGALGWLMGEESPAVEVSRRRAAA